MHTSTSEQSSAKAADNRLKDALSLAIEWLTQTATVLDEADIDFPPRNDYPRWRGAIRGEYCAATRQWSMFCPIWHTGQAVKALVLAAKALNRPELLQNARFSADFILKNRITEGPEKGLILAYEDIVDQTNTSAILESLDGLFMLADATDDPQYGNAAVEALQWVRTHAWTESEARFKNMYDVKNHRFNDIPKFRVPRPLLDDAVFLKGWKRTGDTAFRDIAVKTALRLLKDENPSGNWIAYQPCNPERQDIHPRHAFWWAMPMLDVFRETGNTDFLDCFRRGALWYSNALRADGGFFRQTHTNFKTASFGHATSGSACAAIYFMAADQADNSNAFEHDAALALDYCVSMQFTHPADRNLKGAILERLLPPGGSDASPYFLRDLGTIFFIQAASMFLLNHGPHDAPHA